MNKEIIFLAGLLHDIGKFYQRADEHGTANSQFLSEAIKNNEGLYCPTFKGRYTHKHVLWTADFLDRNRSFFEKILGRENYEPFFKATVLHHKVDQNDVFQKIVQKADHYASGIDRTGEIGQLDGAAENDWDSFKNVRLVSIFEGLLDSTFLAHKNKIPIKALSLTEDVFPNENLGGVPGQPEYANLWKSFESEFSNLMTLEGNTLTTIENLSYLLLKYTSAVPSSTLHLPDVSLYDHLKSTGTFALILFEYLTEKERLEPDFQLQDDDAPALLIGGDLSGIQSYIYDIISTNAAKNLKGRSFYLQILVENTVELLLNKLGLPWSTVVYASGGGFYLLAPNTEYTKATLESVKLTVEETLFALHQTNLSLQLASQPITHGQLLKQTQENGIHNAWAALSQQISALKHQKFKNRLISSFSYFFEPSEVGGAQRRDHITGEEFTAEEILSLQQNQSNLVHLLDGEFPIKMSSKIQIDLGKKLRETDYWITSFERIPSWDDDLVKVGELPIYNYFISNSKISKARIRHPDNVSIRVFNKDNSTTNQMEMFRGKNCVYGFDFYGGNDYPTSENGDPLTFDQLANFNQRGSKKLGILRMDVDNLGAIFISGLGKERKTFSRYSTLSRNLDYFFKGYLNSIWKNRFSTSTNIIYSGGDDLFIVGYWSDVIQFAEQIHQDFSRWVCFNPKLTISGGVALTGGKFPITKGAEFAADAEKKAKEHSGVTTEKNAITLFGTPLQWDFEYPLVKSIKQELVRLIDANQVPRGILNKLQNYSQLARNQKAGGVSDSWRWLIAYDFSRAEQQNKLPEAKNLYNMLKNAAYTETWQSKNIRSFSNYSFLDLLEVSARWAELETKEINS